MTVYQTTMTVEEFELIDIDELLRFIDARDALKKLRKERPWTYDIIRVLWGTRSWISIDQLTRKLWQLRNPSGIPMPRKFRETVQSALNQHSSQSSVFDAKGGNPEDDLFYSPKGKWSGTWALRSREAALAWLDKRNLATV